MPTFYDKFFKPPRKKGMIRNFRTEWASEEVVFKKPVPIKDVEAQIINQWFKTKKKSLANQNPKKKEIK
mgnify:CR=1 FL=1|tara:strand:- start:740 stop:946 length:207 start_codon:yes stop_codon:yes gene_type:complete